MDKKTKRVGNANLYIGLPYHKRKSFPRDSNGFEPLSEYFKDIDRDTSPETDVEELVRQEKAKRKALRKEEERSRKKAPEEGEEERSRKKAPEEGEEERSRKKAPEEGEEERAKSKAVVVQQGAAMVQVSRLPPPPVQKPFILVDDSSDSDGDGSEQLALLRRYVGLVAAKGHKEVVPSVKAQGVRKVAERTQGESSHIYTLPLKPSINKTKVLEDSEREVMEQNVPVEGSKEVVQPDVSALGRRSRNKTKELEDSEREREEVVEEDEPVDGHQMEDSADKKEEVENSQGGDGGEKRISVRSGQGNEDEEGRVDSSHTYTLPLKPSTSPKNSSRKRSEDSKGSRKDVSQHQEKRKSSRSGPESQGAWFVPPDVSALGRRSRNKTKELEDSEREVMEQNVLVEGSKEVVSPAQGRRSINKTKVLEASEREVMEQDVPVEGSKEVVQPDVSALGRRSRNKTTELEDSEREEVVVEDGPVDGHQLEDSADKEEEVENSQGGDGGEKRISVRPGQGSEDEEDRVDSSHTYTLPLKPSTSPKNSSRKRSEGSKGSRKDVSQHQEKRKSSRSGPESQGAWFVPPDVSALGRRSRNKTKELEREVMEQNVPVEGSKEVVSPAPGRRSRSKTKVLEASEREVMEQDVPVEGSKEVVQPDVSALGRRSRNKTKELEDSEREEVVVEDGPVDGHQMEDSDDKEEEVENSQGGDGGEKRISVRPGQGSEDDEGRVDSSHTYTLPLKPSTSPKNSSRKRSEGSKGSRKDVSQHQEKRKSSRSGPESQGAWFVPPDVSALGRRSRNKTKELEDSEREVMEQNVLVEGSKEVVPPALGRRSRNKTKELEASEREVMEQDVPVEGSKEVVQPDVSALGRGSRNKTKELEDSEREEVVEEDEPVDGHQMEDSDDKEEEVENSQGGDGGEKRISVRPGQGSEDEEGRVDSSHTYTLPLKPSSSKDSSRKRSEGSRGSRKDVSQHQEKRKSSRSGPESQGAWFVPPDVSALERRLRNKTKVLEDSEREVMEQDVPVEGSKEVVSPAQGRRSRNKTKELEDSEREVMEQNVPVEGSKEVVQPDVSALGRRSRNKTRVLEDSEREVMEQNVPVEGSKEVDMGMDDDDHDSQRSDEVEEVENEEGEEEGHEGTIVKRLFLSPEKSKGASGYGGMKPVAKAQSAPPSDRKRKKIRSVIPAALKRLKKAAAVNITDVDELNVTNVGGKKYHRVPIKPKEVFTPGVRRSHRTRVPRLEPDEIVEYDKWFDATTLTGSSVTGVLVPAERTPQPRQKNASSAQQLTDDAYPPVPIHDDDGNIVDEQRVVFTPASAEKLNSVGQPEKDSPDGVRIAKYFSGEATSNGLITFDGLAEKSKCKASRYDLFFYVVKGRVLVTINSVQYTLHSHLQIHIPQGTLYSVRNLLSSPAELYYYIAKVVHNEAGSLTQ